MQKYLVGESVFVIVLELLLVFGACGFVLTLKLYKKKKSFEL